MYTFLPPPPPRMSCQEIKGSNFFKTTSIFANLECSGGLAFLGFTILNIFVAFISNYIISLRTQQRRMLLMVPRYYNNNKESDVWRKEFYKFLYYTAASQLVYLFQVIFIITTNLWQLLILVIASTASDYFLYEFDFLQSDKYGRLSDRDDIQ